MRGVFVSLKFFSRVYGVGWSLLLIVIVCVMSFVWVCWCFMVLCGFLWSSGRVLGRFCCFALFLFFL